MRVHRSLLHRACSGTIRIGLIVVLLASIAMPMPAAAADCRSHSYAVYLSPGYEPGVRWGGYHVTITEFSPNHVCNGSMKDVLRHAWRDVQHGKPFSFESKKSKDYWPQELIHPWGRAWGVGFNSGLLTHQLKPKLQKSGFVGVKSHWHVSLYADSGSQAVRKFETTLKGRPWHLYVVRKPDKACQEHGTNCPRNDWEAID